MAAKERKERKEKTWASFLIRISLIILLIYFVAVFVTGKISHYIKTTSNAAFHEALQYELR